MTAPKEIVLARMRYKRCQEISDLARFLGIDTTPVRVNRKYDTWERWRQGRLATGYLLRITGCKLMPGYDISPQRIRRALSEQSHVL